jgi:hypothetical protein
MSMLQADELPDSQEYLDGCSTVTAFKSKKYLENMRTANRGVRINCNVCAMRTNQMGDYESISAWYIPGGIANIFSMNELEKKYRNTYDSWEDYEVHSASGTVKFYKNENGLPYIDLEELSEEAAALLMQTGSKEAANILVQTVCQNYEGYTEQEILEANESRLAMGMIESPTERNFKGTVRSHMINNCPVSTVAISNARAIFGPDLASVRGITVRRITPKLVVGDYVSVPRSIAEHNKNGDTGSGRFFVDGIAFLKTVPRQIKFITAEHVATRTARRLIKHMQVIQV